MTDHKFHTFYRILILLIILVGIAALVSVGGAHDHAQPELHTGVNQTRNRNQDSIPLNNDRVIVALQNGFTPTYVGTDDGLAFIYDDKAGTTQHLRTSMPVFMAFGVSAKHNTLLYSPLKKRIPSGELYLEDLEDGTAIKITDDLTIEAEFSPNESKVAYTFATGSGFGLAVVSLDSRLRKELISENVLPDFFQWDVSGNEIYYFETTNELNTTGVVPHQISVKNKKSTEMTQDSLPPEFPALSPESDYLDPSSKEFSSTHTETRYPFEVVSPDKMKRVCGGNLFGNSFIDLCGNLNFLTQSYLAEGQLLKVTDEGIIVRTFEENRTATDFVDWNGVKIRLAVSPQVSYNLPLSPNGGSFRVTRSGSGYGSNACSLFGANTWHMGFENFAFDMQKTTIGQHVIASAEGTVVYAVGDKNCNSCDSPYNCISPQCQNSTASNGGWGNTVIISHADGTWTKYAHMQFNSVQVSINATACQGLYLGNQGHTGCSNGDVGTCGDHLHFQKQNSSGRDGQSVNTSFSDSTTNPLQCVFYTSGSTETSSCSTCQNGTSTLRNRDGGPPIHPPGSVIKAASSSTVYLIDSDNRKRPITSASVLANLYNQSNANFTTWVITVGQDELDLYEQGGNISSALSGNGKAFPDGKLIGLNGEVSIVTGGGKRRPFTDGNRFTGLGYSFCHVVNVLQTEYNSYPLGPPVDAMPLLTSSLTLSPATGPYNVGQNIAGGFTIKNVGYESLPFSSLGVGGRLNGTTVFDLNFVSTTLAAGSSFPYGSQPRQLSSVGTYDFFAAYQEGNAHWALSVPAAPGVVRTRQIVVGNTCPSPAPITIGQTLNGSLQSGDCLYTDSSYYDAYTFNGTAGQQIYITLNSTQFNAFLFLFQGSYPGGTQIASNNDGGGGTNARIPATSGFFTLPATATYTILANSLAAGETGSYQLFLGTNTCNAPGSFSLSSPSNGQSLSSTTSVNLMWGSSANADSYDVYFGTNSNPPFIANQTGTSRLVNVTPGQTYWWKVVAKVNCGTQTFTTATWSFSIQQACNAPGSFSLSSPSNGQSLSSTTSVNLTWGSSANADSYDVYFGTNSNPPFLANQTGTSRLVNVTPGQTYWWKVVAKVNCGTQTFTTATWSFSIQQACNAPGSFSLSSPSNGQSLSSTTSVNLTWGASANADSYDVYFGTNSNPPFLANQTGTSRLVNVTPGQTYWWKIVAKVNCSTATFTTVTWSFSVQQTPTGNATYNLFLEAPTCGQLGSFCDSGTLLDGRGTITGGSESNQPNTVYTSCADGTSGTYHSDESADKIRVLTLDGTNFGPGKAVRIEVTVWAWTTPAEDHLDIYYAADANNPNWVYLATLEPSVVGAQVLSTTYTLPIGGSLQAVRARFRYQGTAGSCVANNDYDDYDDLIFAASTGTPPARTRFDYEGDGKADVSVFRPTNGGWYFSNSSNGAFSAVQFGMNGDLIAPADFDGDGKTDVSVFRPSTGAWYRLNSSTNSFVGVPFGQSGDIPVPGDFDGDGRADISVFRPSNGYWYRLNSSNGQFVANQFGANGDKPQVGNFDGDTKTDLAVFRPSTSVWHILRSSDGTYVGTPFGQFGDIATPADFEGDGRADICVFRPSNGTWYRLNSSNGQPFSVQFGANGDIPAAADFDGDGKADPAVFRPSIGGWYLLRSTSGFISQQFGASGDVPTPAAFGR